MKWDLDCIQETVTDDGRVRPDWHGEEWGILARALADEAPKYDRPHEQPANCRDYPPKHIRNFTRGDGDNLSSVAAVYFIGFPTVGHIHSTTIGAGARIGPGQADAAWVDVPQCRKTIVRWS